MEEPVMRRVCSLVLAAAALGVATGTATAQSSNCFWPTQGAPCSTWGGRVPLAETYSYVYNGRKGAFAWNQDSTVFWNKGLKLNPPSSAVYSTDPRWKWFVTTTGSTNYSCFNAGSGNASMRCGTYY
jgi:hypothetical protein